MIEKAIHLSKKAQLEWDLVPLKERVSIWLKAANLMATKYRMELNATTMAGQSKTVIQAEIDSAAELIDFFRYSFYLDCFYLLHNILIYSEFFGF